MIQSDMDQLSERVRCYVRDNFLYMHPGYELRDDEPLLGKGIIDSLGVMELIAFVEDELGVPVADADVTEEHFGTVAAVARYAATRRSGAVTAA